MARGPHRRRLGMFAFRTLLVVIAGHAPGGATYGQPPQFTLGETVEVLLENGAPTEIGVGESVTGEVVGTDGGGLYVRVKYGIDGRAYEDSFLAAFVGRQIPSIALSKHEGEVRTVEFGAGGKQLYSVDTSGELRVVNVATRQPTNRFKLNFGVNDAEPRGMRLSHDRKLLAAFGVRGLVVMEAARGTKLGTWQSPRGRSSYHGEILGAAFSANNAILAIAHKPYDGGTFGDPPDGPQRVEMIDPENGDSVASSAGVERLHDVAISPDGKWLGLTCSRRAAGNDPNRGWQGFAELWELRTLTKIATVENVGRTFREFDGRNELYIPLAFSADSRRLAAGASVIDVASQKIVARLSGAPATYDLAFLPNGSALVSAGDDHELAFWNPANGEQLASVDAHGNGLHPTVQILCVAASPDGAWVATGGTDKLVRLWKVTDAIRTPR